MYGTPLTAEEEKEDIEEAGIDLGPLENKVEGWKKEDENEANQSPVSEMDELDEEEDTTDTRDQEKMPLAI